MPSQAQIRQAFAVFDSDRSGYVTPDELRAILMRPVRGQSRFTDASVAELLKRFDSNSDGRLSVEEFALAWASLAAEASLEQLMALVAAPAEERFADLVAEGAGCEIPKTEERAITLRQLAALRPHIERRCAKEKWLDHCQQPLTPERASLYEVCRHVIKPATEAKQTSYVELVALELVEDACAGLF